MCTPKSNSKHKCVKKTQERKTRKVVTEQLALSKFLALSEFLPERTCSKRSFPCSYGFYTIFHPKSQILIPLTPNRSQSLNIWLQTSKGTQNNNNIILKHHFNSNHHLIHFHQKPPKLNNTKQQHTNHFFFEDIKMEYINNGSETPKYKMY